jgi:hypothetical protein
MRLYDLRRGQVTDIEPARRRLLRLSVPGPDPASLGDLRILLVADLIRRNAESHRLVVEAGQADAADAAALGLRPPETDRLDGVADIQVGGPDPGDAARHWTVPGAVRPDGHRPGGDDDPVRLAGLAERGIDPLALRLAFLEHPYRDELTLTWPALADADQALRATRRQVADWATHPSRPLSAPHAAEVTAAFDDDLFTPGALVTLRALAGSTRVPPGAKFETFAHLDQLLGLDLAREVGR